MTTFNAVHPPISRLLPQRWGMRSLPPLDQLEGLAKGLTCIVTGPTRSDIIHSALIQASDPMLPIQAAHADSPSYRALFSPREGCLQCMPHHELWPSFHFAALMSTLACEGRLIQSQYCGMLCSALL